METMLRVWEKLGIPVALDKLEGPATDITFLGITINTTLQQLRLPHDKLEEMVLLIKSWGGTRLRNKTYFHLSASCPLLPKLGRLFLSRLIELSTTVSKLHHHICLNVEAKEDILWMPNPSVTYSPDASGTLAYGAYMYFNEAWFRDDWLPCQMTPLQSIQWQELFAIVAAARPVHCDNMEIAQAWSYQSARQPGILHLLRTLFFVSAQHSFIVRLVHLPSKTEPHCRRSFPQPVATIFCPCPTGQPTANSSTSSAGRALSHPMEQLLSRALAPSTSNTYKIRLLKQRLFKSTPSPASNNAVIKLLIQGIERSMPAAHLMPKRQPITNKMLGQMLSHLDRDHKTTHDGLLLRAAITLGFFGLLRVGELTVPNQRWFNPDLHLTAKDLTMRKGQHDGADQEVKD
eukprot:Em0005g463a